MLQDYVMALSWWQVLRNGHADTAYSWRKVQTKYGKDVNVQAMYCTCAEPYKNIK